jgi:U2-associated protein SR140
MNGDSWDRWSTQPFDMFEGGPIFVPPFLPFCESEEYQPSVLEQRLYEPEDLDDDDDEEVDIVLSNPYSSRVGYLRSIDRLRLEGLLRHLCSSRESIAEAMVFCIQHSEAAIEIIDLITSSLVLSLSSDPLLMMSRKLSRLYLLSDLLHNSNVTVHHAWKFRNALETVLPLIFRHWRDVVNGFDSKLKIESWRVSSHFVYGI